MDALFIIPALISPSVPDRLVPGLAKMVERNTVLTYSSTIRIAALRRYASIFKYATSESDTSLSEGPGTTGGTLSGTVTTGYRGGTTTNLDPTSFGPGKSGEVGQMGKITKLKPDEVEVPNGISFYNAVSLEPTFMEIPITQKKDVLGLTGDSERIIRIGFKCVPYKLDGVTEIKKYLANSRNIHLTQGYLSRKIENIKKKIWMSAEREIYKGHQTSGNPIKDIMMGPSSEDLSNPNRLMNLMDSRGPSRWSSIMMFTTFDFEDQEMKELLDQYRNIVKSGWGDIVIINENKESINFCTTKMLACYEYPYTYLREILKMGNVIDYREIKGYTRPFNMISIRGAFKECACQVEETEPVNEGVLGAVLSSTVIDHRSSQECLKQTNDGKQVLKRENIDKFLKCWEVKMKKGAVIQEQAVFKQCMNIKKDKEGCSKKAKEHKDSILAAIKPRVDHWNKKK